MTRDQEYGHTISLPDEWERKDGHITSPEGGQLRIIDAKVIAGTTLDQFAEGVRDTPREEWWPSASVFEITNFGKRQVKCQEFYSPECRVQDMDTILRSFTP